jgi:hypothetical protein
MVLRVMLLVFPLITGMRDTRMISIPIACICWAIINGRIVEGFDTGDKGRNPEPERTIMGPAVSGDSMVVIVLMKRENTFIVKTVFPVKNNPRYTKYLPKDKNKK